MIITRKKTSIFLWYFTRNSFILFYFISFLCICVSPPAHPYTPSRHVITTSRLETTTADCVCGTNAPATASRISVSTMTSSRPFCSTFQRNSSSLLRILFVCYSHSFILSLSFSLSLCTYLSQYFFVFYSFMLCYHSQILYLFTTALFGSQRRRLCLRMGPSDERRWRNFGKRRRGNSLDGIHQCNIFFSARKPHIA